MDACKSHSLLVFTNFNGKHKANQTTNPHNMVSALFIYLFCLITLIYEHLQSIQHTIMTVGTGYKIKCV